MRDITQAQFEKAMRERGWEPSFLGYWQRNGLGICRLNYRTNRQALAAFIAWGEKHDKEAAERAAKKREKEGAK